MIDESRERLVLLVAINPGLVTRTLQITSDGWVDCGDAEFMDHIASNVEPI